MTRLRSSIIGSLSRRQALSGLGLMPVAGSALLGTPATAHADSGRPVPRDLLPGGAFEQFVAQRAAQDLFSGTVLLAHRGHPVLIRSYGMANRQASLANQPDTLYNLASVTKSFTSIAIAQLVQQGRMAFHDTLGTYLDGFPPAFANTATIHHLLTHSSGMGDYSRSPDFPEGRKQWSSAAETMDGVMAIIRKQSETLGDNPPFAPGARYSYSNSGFFVLGAIVEQVSGQSYFDYVRERVFAPAGMTRSDFYTKPQVLARNDIAHPYWTPQPGASRADFTESEYFGFIGGPADGAYSNIADMLKFTRALRAGRLLSPALVALITSGKVVLSPSDQPLEPYSIRYYGYGFRNTVVGNELVFGHSGSGAGRATNFDIYPELDWVAVILSNYDTPVAPIVQLERQLVSRQGESA
jgi:CubicO group peptidase (beta-lactamase class C family)